MFDFLKLEFSSYYRVTKHVDNICHKNSLKKRIWQELGDFLLDTSLQAFEISTFIPLIADCIRLINI